MQMIAMISMLIDHIGIAFYKNQEIWRIIGRLAFPLYAYGIVQGYLHTSSYKNYVIRLLILAAVSQLPYMLALHQISINVIGTFVVCLLVLMSLDRIKNRYLKALIVIAPLILMDLLQFDYGSYGLLLVLSYRYLNQQCIYAHLALNVAFVLYKGWNLQLVSIIPTILIVYYPQLLSFIGKVKVPRWLWRSFYPVHLLALAIIKMM